MAGHSKWKQIKHKKEAADKNRSKVFAKLANAISIAAKKEPNPDFNPTLRSIIERAKKENMPQENIKRALNKAKEVESLEELFVEIFGPEGSGIIIELVTDNRNRTMNEVKIAAKKHEAKIALPGGLSWSFEKTESGYIPKFKQQISEEAREKIDNLIEELNSLDETQNIYLNI
ncbi:MAG TPA: YebC/PmpR family DNA-binding transcriptional regulator [Candidatus Paceibacterota bacterium]